LARFAPDLAPAKTGSNHARIATSDIAAEVAIEAKTAGRPAEFCAGPI
jgi:hypothetical protein